MTEISQDEAEKINAIVPSSFFYHDLRKGLHLVAGGA